MSLTGYKDTVAPTIEAGVGADPLGGQAGKQYQVPRVDPDSQAPESPSTTVRTGAGFDGVLLAEGILESDGEGGFHLGRGATGRPG